MSLINSRRKPAGNVLYWSGIIIAGVSFMWFFAIYASINPNSIPLLDISKPLPSKAPDNITYQINIQNNISIIHQASEEKSITFDVTGIITGLISGIGTFLIGGILRKKFFPNF